MGVSRIQMGHIVDNLTNQFLFLIYFLDIIYLGNITIFFIIIFSSFHTLNIGKGKTKPKYLPN